MRSRAGSRQSTVNSAGFWAGFRFACRGRFASVNAIRREWLFVVLAAALAGLPCGCAHRPGNGTAGDPKQRPAVQAALEELRAKYAPDSRMAIFDVGVAHWGRELVLTGDVDRAEARVETVQAVRRTGAKVTDRIQVLPEESLGEELWGIACLSVVNGRLQPQHKAEMGTQVLMGEVVRVWKRSNSSAFAWYLAQTADGYLSWLQRGTFVRCTREQAEAWQNGPLLIVTAMESCIREQPQAGAEPVSDVVMCDLVRKTGAAGEWYAVELPDGRAGYLPKGAADDYAAWKQARQATAENVERTARMFLGRPYLWGGNSPNGLDCSGFTKVVFYLNGIDLLRDSREQATQGVAVPLDADLSHLKKGDLLFFGRSPRGGGPKRVTHVGIYLGDKLFIHSSGRVQIASLDPESPIRDESRIRSLLGARRVLPAQ